jgi:uncharacterized protein YrrD
MKQMRRFRELADLTLQAADGDIGSVEDLYFDDGRWTVRYFVVKTGGWLLGRHIVVTPASIEEIDDQGGVLRLRLTREQIEQAPPIERARPIDRAYEEAYFRYFRMAPYWDTVPGPSPTVVPYPGTVPPAAMSTAPPSQAARNPTLRSANDLIGAGIHARDGDIGYVEDLVVDDEEWVLHYVEVDTRKWLPGKKVLVQMGRIERIDWEDRFVAVALTRRAIESAPAYDPAELITPDYEIQLFKHYSQAAA